MIVWTCDGREIAHPMAHSVLEMWLPSRHFCIHSPTCSKFPKSGHPSLLQHFRLFTLRMQSAPARDGAIASDVRVCGQARYTNTSSIQRPLRALDREEELETELVSLHSKLMLKTYPGVLKHKNVVITILLGNFFWLPRPKTSASLPSIC